MRTRRPIASAGQARKRSVSRPAAGTRRIAAIDVGSNSIRQIVADVSSEGAIRVVDEMKAAPRLAAGLSEAGALSADAMTRAVDAIARMVTLGRQLGAQRIDMVATSAVRDAENASEFSHRVRAATGIPLRILDGSEEARLAFRSALAHFDLATARAAVVDIGGGSIELALSARGVIDRLVSLPLGTLRLTERFLEPDCAWRDVKRLRKAVRKALKKELPAREWRGTDVIGSGGTFTNLAAIILAREGLQTVGTVHGTHISRGDVEHVLESLTDTTLEERRAIPGLNPLRADIIVAGIAVIAEVLARLDAHELVVSGYGIREGLLLEAARVRASIANPGEARRRSVQRFAESCRYEEVHSQHVRKLALILFDAMGKRLGCTREDRHILGDAALLHDVGYHISYDKHHKHSYYLISHAELLGMSPAEQVVVANIARYHRGSPPKKRHVNFMDLDEERREQVMRLAAILRVADGFDRGHGAAVERLDVRWSARSLRITPVARRGQQIRLEMWGAARKADLLAELAGVPVEIVGARGRVLARIGDEETAADELDAAGD